MTNTQTRPKLPLTLKTLQFLRTTIDEGDSEIHPMLNNAYVECKENDVLQLFERILLHIGDVSRQHNLLLELGIKSDKGGAQQRKTFRAILRWWEKTMPESFLKNLRVFTEFTLYENLVYYQIRSDRWRGDIQDVEILLPNPKAVYSFIKDRIRSGKDIELIAKHLPKYESGKNRVTTKVSNRNGTWRLPIGKDWVRVNGEIVTGEKVLLNVGDIIKYPRAKGEEVITKQKVLNKWIMGFCKEMNWTLGDYKKFRSKQNTPEQKFSDKSILQLPKSEFVKFLDGLTAGQRFRVIGILQRSYRNNVNGESQWDKLFKWYQEWETNQEAVAQKLRDAFDSGDEKTQKELQGQLKVKSTGKTTFDLLQDLFSGDYTDQQIDNTYQSMTEKMDLVANVFPIVDGSGSMDSSVNGNSWGGVQKSEVSRRNIAYALAIAFSTRNPNPEFRDTLGWFSTNFHIIGHSKFKNNKPNKWVEGNEFYERGDGKKILSAKKSFTENYESLKKNDPGHISSTNIGAAIKYFIEFSKKNGLSPESLPQALLFLTDNEHNTGIHPTEAMALANEIGWHPLCIFWGIQQVPPDMLRTYQGTQNLLLLGGFSENVLSQVLRGIKNGSVDPEDELWAINDDVRYSVL